MKISQQIKHILTSMAVIAVATSCTAPSKVAQKPELKLPKTIIVNGVAQNPEGIEYDKRDNTFLLSSINAAPIIKIKPDGTYKAFTSGENFPLSTAGLQIDYKHNRLLVAGFNGMELMDNKPETKGTAFLRVYNLETGVLQKDINLSHLAPKASVYFANDVAVDTNGNAYISDWYAGVIYKVDLAGNASLFWTNNTGISGGPNGLDFHKDGYLLVSLLKVNEKGLYSDYALLNIPLTNPQETKTVIINKSGYAGFDGMVLKEDGNIIGITNNQTTPGGNTFLELSSQDNWKSADVVATKVINPSTTIALTPQNEYYIINQSFMTNFSKKWTIENVK